MTRLRSPRHLANVRMLPCCLTGWTPVDAAHIRRFSGMGIRPPDNHCLPLRHTLHLYGEHRIGDFWERAGFPFDSDNDPRIWAERLYECEDHGEREALVRDMQGRADRIFVASVLREIAA